MRARSCLTRRFAEVGDIVRVDRGTWGLKEWYPGRSFKTKAENDGKELVVPGKAKTHWRVQQNKKKDASSSGTSEP